MLLQKKPAHVGLCWCSTYQQQRSTTVSCHALAESAQSPARCRKRQLQTCRARNNPGKVCVMLAGWQPASPPTPRWKLHSTSKGMCLFSYLFKLYSSFLVSHRMSGGAGLPLFFSSFSHCLRFYTTLFSHCLWFYTTLFTFYTGLPSKREMWRHWRVSSEGPQGSSSLS